MGVLSVKKLQNLSLNWQIILTELHCSHYLFLFFIIIFKRNYLITKEPGAEQRSTQLGRKFMSWTKNSSTSSIPVLFLGGILLNSTELSTLFPPVLIKSGHAKCWQVNRELFPEEWKSSFHSENNFRVTGLRIFRKRCLMLFFRGKVGFFWTEASRWNQHQIAKCFD